MLQKLNTTAYYVDQTVKSLICNKFSSINTVFKTAFIYHSGAPPLAKLCFSPVQFAKVCIFCFKMATLSFQTTHTSYRKKFVY